MTVVQYLIVRLQNLPNDVPEDRGFYAQFGKTNADLYALKELLSRKKSGEPLASIEEVWGAVVNLAVNAAFTADLYEDVYDKNASH